MDLGWTSFDNNENSQFIHLLSNGDPFNKNMIINIGIYWNYGVGVGRLFVNT